MKKTLNTTAFQIVIGISLLLLVLQLWNMQFNLADKYKAQAQQTSVRDIFTNPDRGIIYDRNGYQLVKNDPRYAIAVTRTDLPTGNDLYVTPANLPTDAAARIAFYSKLATLLNRPDITSASLSRTVAAADPQRPYQPLLLATAVDASTASAISKATDGKGGDILAHVWLAAAQKRVFDGLSALVNAPNVVYMVPQELPIKGSGDNAVSDEAARNMVYSNLAQELAPLGGPDAKAIAGKLGDALSNDRPVMVFSGISDVVAEEIRLNAAAMPGIHVSSELEYNYLRAYSSTALNPVIIKSNVSHDVYMQVATKSRELPGSSAVTEPIRVYSDGPLFAHLLGYLGLVSDTTLAANPLPLNGDHPDEPVRPIYLPGDKVGAVGVEASLESQLRGSKGIKEVQVDNGGNPQATIGELPPVPGNNVYLTVDTGLQKAVTASLQKYIQQAGVTSGVAIVEDVHSGQILAMVSLPSYDNNLFASGISQADFDKLNKDPNLPMFNRAISGNYPPGSTFKMIMASAGLQSGVITPDSTYYTPGYIRVPYTGDNTKSNLYYDWNLARNQNLNVVQALGDSSDTFFYNLGGPKQQETDGQYTRFLPPNSNSPIFFNGLGIERINQYAQYFGLGQPTGIELPNEAVGRVPDRQWKLKTFNDDWSLGDTLISSIGQGYDLVTPLQLANATAAIANGGTLYQPTLVYRVNSGDHSGSTVQNFQSKVLGQVQVSAANLAVVRQGMRIAVTGGDGVYGTARRINYTSLAVAGKTGTAEFGEPLPGKQYRPSHAWFTSFAPFDNPQIAVTVFIQGGAGNGQVNSRQLEGTTYAAPVAADIYKYYFNLSETLK